MSLRRDTQVLRAALASGIYRIRIGAPWLAEGLAFVRTVTRSRSRVKTPFSLWCFRVRQCRTCDLYDPERRTCGRNFGTIKANGKRFPNGCGCLVGVKASYLDAECTAVSMGMPSRWRRWVFAMNGKAERHPLDKVKS